MNRSVTWMARNHVAANLLMVFVMFTGVLSVVKMKKETFPEFDLDQIQINVPYLGASPADVEDGVVRRIEERITGLEGIRKVRSTAAEGMGMVTLEIELDAEMDQVLDKVKNEIDRIDTFPAETEEPVVKEMLRRNRVIDILVHGHVSEKALKVAAERVREDLRTAGISQVELLGVRTDEISIEVSEAALRRHSLTLSQIAGIVRRTSLDLPAGSVRGDQGEVLLRTQGLRYDGRDYEDLVVYAQPDGTTLLLGEIAAVVDGFEDSDLESRFNGRPAAVVQVYRTGGESALEISDQAKAYVAANRSRMPEGISIDYVRDDARLLRSRLDLLIRNAELGLLFVFICLSLFLDLRLAFWVMMGIPISFLGSFLLIEPTGASINMLSLFAFIVALGIVVDDAIVVGENIFAHRERGKSFIDAAIDGVLEVGKPVFFTILTSVAAFLPLAFVDGLMGKFMVVIPIIVISVLLLSLVEALYILPAHLSSRPGLPSQLFGRLLAAPLAFHRRVARRANRAMRWVIDHWYAGAVRRAVQKPMVITAIALSMMLITVGWIAGGHIKFVFMPSIDSDILTISVQMPEGATIDETRRVVEKIEIATLAARDEYDAERDGGSVYRNVYSIIGDTPMGRFTAMSAAGSGGGGQAHLAEITIELMPSEERNIPSAEISDRIRERAGEIPGPRSVIYKATIFSAGNAIELQLAHQDFDQLLAAVSRLKEEIANYPGTREIQDSFQEGKLEMKLDLKPQARGLGLTTEGLARQVREGFYGAQALRIQRGRDDARVMVRYPESERRDLSDIESMRIRTTDGSEVAFSYVAEVDVGYGYATIQRSDGQRIVTVSADIDDNAANATDINSDLQTRFLPRLVEDYPGLRYSFEGEQREQSESFASLGQGFLVAMLAIYALLAIPFRSYTQPLVIMSAIPFGMIGAVWGHVIMGLDLALLSLFGIVALSGVVVNDSLILLTFYNQLRAGGLERDAALVEAGKQRFRPILLTSLTTFFALLPMIMEKSVQAQFLIPMAVSLGFGIMFATCIILLGVPAGMKNLDVILGWIQRAKARDEKVDTHLMPNPVG
ncbi:MAG: efflux RND transporter permease subunit [Candidatus Latescibacterota bacterium]|nr:efflux RND transporter permease subunit [Candidatus Latescibacterota bacterium]